MLKSLFKAFSSQLAAFPLRNESGSDASLRLGWYSLRHEPVFAQKPQRKLFALPYCLSSEVSSCGSFRIGRSNNKERMS